MPRGMPPMTRSEDDFTGLDVIRFAFISKEKNYAQRATL